MPNLINRLRSAPTCIKAIGNIDHERIGVSNVPIGMNHARGNNDEDGVISTNFMNFVCLRLSRPVLPKMELIGTVEEDKSITLILVLMGPASHAGLRAAEITHGGFESGRKLVVSIQFHEPAPSVFISFEWFELDASNCHSLSRSARQYTGE
jgi:hypothetical protein